jgi:hypothetical protein
VWVKLDDRFPRNPKVRGLSDRAFRSYVEGLCHCGEQETNGQVDPASARAIARPRAIAELVDAGLWLVDPEPKGGYWVKDYLDFNPSREEIQRQRTLANERKRRYRELHGGNA